MCLQDDNRLLMKSLPPKMGACLPPLSGVARDIVCDLLDALTVPVPPEESIPPPNLEILTETTALVAAAAAAASSTAPPVSAALSPNEAVAATAAAATSSPARRFTSRNVRQQELIRNSSSSDLLTNDAEEASAEEARRDGLARKKDVSAEELDRKRRPLLPKSAICRLLAELVRSYAGCARLVTEHSFPAKISDLVKEETSALAFLLDYLLPSCQTAGDKESPALVRTLIASLASCNHAPEAQNALVAEVKGSLSRALVLPESNDKHNRLQSLTALLSTMIESCPSTGPHPQPLSTAFKQQTVGMNNMVKFMLKRGLVTDLARIPHSLDMSSPLMAFTVNAALKPLEALSRIVNLPPTTAVAAGRPAAKPKADENDQQETASQQAAASTSDSSSTRAQAVEMSNAADGENTEQDVSVVGENLDNAADDETTTRANALEEDMDQHNAITAQVLD